MRIIRELEERDIEEISRIEQESFSMPWSANAFRQLLQDSNSIYLVAEEDGKIVGSCGVSDVCGEGNIDNVVVSEEYRNRGIATALMVETLKRGRERGITAFTLEVRVSNAPAIKVYEKMGFVSEGIRPGFYEKPKEDAMIMWLRDHMEE